MRSAIRTDRQRQRGEATTEMVLVTPVLLLLIAFVIQFALWYHASHVAGAAAQEGVRAARAYDGTAAAGRERAERFLAATGPGIVLGPDVRVTRDVERARAEVHGRAPSVVPGMHLPVDAIAESPTERLTSPQLDRAATPPPTTGRGR
jgi:Flp pilus assembly protein TadG